MKLLVITILLLSAVSVVCAADVCFSIGSFRPTDLLEYSLVPYLSNITEYNHYSSDNNSINTLGNLSLHGSLIAEQPAYYIKLYSTVNPGYRFYKQNSNLKLAGSRDSQEDYLNIDATNTIEYRQYWGNFSLGSDMEFYLYRYKSNYESNSEVQKTESTFNNWKNTVYLAGTMGYGRLYECQEAYLAWYALRELEDNNCLAKQPTEEEHETLATLLYGIRSINFADSRKQYRHQIMPLLAYLKAQDFLSDDAETTAMAILLELWDYSSNPKRLVGTKLEAKPFVQISNNKSNTTNHNNQADAQQTNYISYTHNQAYYAKAGVELNLIHQLPLCNIFQLGGIAGVQQGWFDAFYREAESDSLKINQKPYTYLYGNYAVTVYPDNRSSISLKADASLWINNLWEANDSQRIKQSQYALNSTLFTDKPQNFQSSLSLGASYNATRRISLKGELFLKYINSQEAGETVDDYFKTGGNLGISYQLL